MHVMNQLFDRWDADGIAYLHFKSNVNLDFSFHDKGDFDILVDPDRKKDVIAALNGLDAKQMNTPSYKRYPGVDNWLLFDRETGMIHHLHLHYQIMSGKAYVKDYEIPWREILLETRIYDPEWKIYVADPALELMLLNVRSVIKSHLSDSLKARIGLYRTHKSLQQERRELIARVSPERVREYMGRVFSDRDAEKMTGIVCRETLDSRSFLQLSCFVRKEMQLNRRMSGWCAWWASQTGFFRFVLARLAKKRNRFAICKKVPMSKGAVIAFVGVDGSGKSTTAKEIYRWLGQQVECTRVYMGLGDGNTTLYMKVMKKLRGAVRRGADADSESINSRNYQKKDPVSFRKNPKFYIRKRLLISSVYSVEKNNEKKMRRMSRYRINGGFSILDRYPQTELPNVNDGPKIGAYRHVIKADRYIDRMEKKESGKMSIVRTVRPDVVFRLEISAEESMRRKPEQTDISLVQRKIDDLRSITFQNAEIVDVDAMQPYAEELLAIKSKIWEML